MEETLQALQGTVARVIYENSETGYTVFELAADGGTPRGCRNHR